MSGPLRTAKIQCYQGVDISLTTLYFDPPVSGSTSLQDLEPMDFTGATARMSIRLEGDPRATEVLFLETGSGLEWASDTFAGGPAAPSVNNGITISITRTQSLDMNGGRQFVGGYYDVLADMADGTTVEIMAGQFDLMATVTRTAP